MGHRFNPMLTFLLRHSNSFDQSNRVLLPISPHNSFYSLNLFKNMSPLFPMTTLMYLPEMVSYDIAVIAKLMLWDTMFDKSRHQCVDRHLPMCRGTIFLHIYRGPPYSFTQNIPLSPIFMGHRFNPMLTFLLRHSNSFDQSNRVLPIKP
jgi:hypothetical protein